MADSIWNAWTDGARVLSARTARAALVRLIAHVSAERVWLPAYICPEMPAVAPPASIRFYPFNETLSPDIARLRHDLRAGDLVFVVDLFGWPPSAEFRQFVAEHPDMIWVEDRAHALWLAERPWGDWQLFSPRKLVGVPDGGLLVAVGQQDMPGTIHGVADPTFAMPELMRFEDAGEERNATWYAAYQKREVDLTADPLPLSRLSRGLLERIPITPLVERRQRNYRFLAARLAPSAPFPRAADGVAPFGFPLKVDDAGRLAAALAQERLFCARHWAALPSDAQAFPREHALSRQLLTLPCDHRYDETQLGRLVGAVERLL